MTDWVTVAFSAVSAAAAAYFGAYLGKRAERKAMQQTLDQVERRIADITEAARLRWSKRAEVCAALYGKLMMVEREFRFYLSSNTASTDEAVARLASRFQEFQEHFLQNALFLPTSIKGQVASIDEECGHILNVTTLMRPAKPLVESGEIEPTHQSEIRRIHYGKKEQEGKRFRPDGDIGQVIRKIEEALRESLEVE